VIASVVVMVALAFVAGLVFGVATESAIADGRARRRCTDCIFRNREVCQRCGKLEVVDRHKGRRLCRSCHIREHRREEAVS
jgi:hypothetical protein